MNWLCQGSTFSDLFYIDTIAYRGSGIAPSVRDWQWAGRSCDRIPVGARFSAPVQTGPGAHPASHMSFPRVKRPGCGVDHPPHLAPTLKKEYICTSTPPLGLHGVLQGDIYVLSFHFQSDVRTTL